MKAGVGHHNRLEYSSLSFQCDADFIRSSAYNSRRVLSNQMALPAIKSPPTRYRYFQVITFKQPLTAVDGRSFKSSPLPFTAKRAIKCCVVLCCPCFRSLVYFLHVTLPIRTRMVSRSHHKINNISIPRASLMQRERIMSRGRGEGKYGPTKRTKVFNFIFIHVPLFFHRIWVAFFCSWKCWFLPHLRHCFLFRINFKQSYLLHITHL